MIDLSIIAPCYNEENNVLSLVKEISKNLNKKEISSELILVDDGSRDQTSNKIKKLDDVYLKTKIVKIYHEYNKGIFESWKSAVKKANGHIICFIDSDLQNPPSEILNLYEKLINSHYDVVQGSRNHIGHENNIRFILSIGLNYLLNFIFNIKSKDNKSGFFLGYNNCIQDILNLKYEYYFAHTFCRISAEYKGYDVGEIETLFEKRKTGKSFLTDFPIIVICKVLCDIVIGLIEFRFLSRKKNEFDRFLDIHKPLKEPKKKSLFKNIFWKLYIFLTPLHKWTISSRFASYYDSLMRTQYLSNQDLKKLQLLKLQKLVRHCYYRVPYYREKFDELNLKPNDIKTLEDITKIPLLNKEDVRKNIHFKLFSNNHNKKNMLKIITSGSTGQPFVTYADKKQLEIRLASTIRSSEWAGWEFGDRQVRLWHQTIGMSLLQVFKEKLDAVFMRRVFIPAYEMKEKSLDNFFNKIKKHNPVLIDGYAESFNFLGQYLLKHPKTEFKVKSVISSAQILSDQVRNLIEKKLNCKVYDKYGSREFSGIAYEDSSNYGHLVQMESYVVELLKNNITAKPNEDGEIIITDLNNYSFPLIRYRIGDLAEALDNSNLSKFEIQMDRIGKIKGRTQALIHCSNGKWLPGTFFAHFFKEYSDFILQFQVIQEQKGEFDLKIIKTDLYNNDIEDRILKELRSFTGNDTKINILYVNQIVLLETGKRSPVISKVKVDFQELN
jgi:phenylacetate-CoA ligase